MIRTLRALLALIICVVATGAGVPAAPALVCAMTGRPMAVQPVANQKATHACCRHRASRAAAVQRPPCCAVRAGTGAKHVPAIQNVPPVFTFAFAWAAGVVRPVPKAHRLPAYAIVRAESPRVPPGRRSAPRAPPTFS